MKRIFFISLTYCLTAFLLTFLHACSGGEEKAALSPRDSLVHHINILEELIVKNKSSNQLDQKIANQTLDAYRQFTSSYKKDSLCAWYLFRGADLASGALGMHEQGVNMYDEIIHNHRSFLKYPETLFLAGFISQDKLNDGERAKKYYDQLIADYPQHEFTDDAMAMMSFFGKSDEEIVKEFEKKNEEKMKK